MSTGNLVHIEHSDLNATLELLDSLGVTPQSFNTLRKCSSWEQQIVARVICLDTDLMQMLMMEDSAKKAGFSLSDFGHLAGDEEMMRKIRDVVRGCAEIKPIEHLINLDDKPFIPPGWEVREEDQLPGRVRGFWKWNEKEVLLFLSKPQEKGEDTNVRKLCKILANKPVLPATVLDYLLKHQELIPAKWKGKLVFFWGTIYRDPTWALRVRCLVYDGGQWSWGWHPLDRGWSDVDSAALYAGCLMFPA